MSENPVDRDNIIDRLSTVLAAESSEMANLLAAEPVAIANLLSVAPREMAEALATNPDALAHILAAEPAVVANLLAENSEMIANIIAAEPAVTARILAAEPTVIANLIADEVLSSGQAPSRDLFAADAATAREAEMRSPSIMDEGGIGVIIDEIGTMTALVLDEIGTMTALVLDEIGSTSMNILSESAGASPQKATASPVTNLTENRPEVLADMLCSILKGTPINSSATEAVGNKAVNENDSSRD